MASGEWYSWWQHSLLLLSLAVSVNGVADDSLLWGPYKPNLYFGVRARLPESLTTALLWSRVEDYESVQKNFRYTCETGDNMAGYGWEEYDARTGGRQTIHDVGNRVDITTEFVKIPSGPNGGNWGARISGKPREDAPNVRTTVVFAANMEGLGDLQFENEHDPRGYTGDISFRGQTQDLGLFNLEITKGPPTNRHPFVEHPSAVIQPLDRTIVNSVKVPPENAWQTKPIAFQVLKANVEWYIAKYGQENIPPPAQLFTLANGANEGANVHLVQKVFEGAFEFDVLYSSASASKPLTSEDLTEAIQSNAKSFQQRFKEVFRPATAFKAATYEGFSKALFSNLLGGVGYFYGNSIVDTSYATEYEEEDEGFWTAVNEARQRAQPTLQGPYELFTSVPSRPFFPRGFLWDEGFHLLPILDFDTDFTLEIIHSWFKLMNEDGWIAREQILGDEARSKVPPEFQVQAPHIANPPTLFLVLEGLLDKLKHQTASKVSPDDAKRYTTALRDMYPLLKRHYQWYRKTQKGDIKSYDREAFSTREAYRWRGRTPKLVLASGLDDYPRAQPPHPGELHLDLMSWMGLLARDMKRIATTLGETSDATDFSVHETAILRNLDDLHWSDNDQAYCDATIDEYEENALVCHKGYKGVFLVFDATIDEYEENALVCHKGYISLFPFMTGLIGADSPKLPALLDLIADENELWSPHGIRSLSKKDALYATEENYWRSPVWLNMNYLILTNLQTLAQSKGPQQARAKELFMALQANLVRTVYESWKETGFAWEQYSPETGRGQRTAHFTGWTSLVVKVMCLEVGERREVLGHEEL